MRIENKTYLDFKDVLIKPKRSDLNSRSEVTLERTFKCKHSGVTWSGIPIIAANMDTVGTFEMAKELSKVKMLTAIHKHYTIKDWKDFSKSLSKKKRKEVFSNIFITLGSSKEDLEKTREILNIIPEIDKICIDIANGYSNHFLNSVKKLRKVFPRYYILAGNVVSYEMAEELIISGASCSKVGIGSGAACLTRKVTGVGIPQLSATMECSDATHGLDGHSCSDGGCTVPGDIAKAFAAGADFVMLGGMLAGHKESNLDIIEKNGKQFMQYYGMSSSTAMKKHNGGVNKYRASEGKAVEIPYKGKVKNTILEILGGLRSTCTYVGARELKHLTKRTTFIRVTQQINEIFGKS